MTQFFSKTSVDVFNLLWLLLSELVSYVLKCLGVCFCSYALLGLLGHPKKVLFLFFKQKTREDSAKPHLPDEQTEIFIQTGIYYITAH